MFREAKPPRQQFPSVVRKMRDMGRKVSRAKVNLDFATERVRICEEAFQLARGVAADRHQALAELMDMEAEGRLDYGRLARSVAGAAGIVFDDGYHEMDDAEIETSIPHQWWEGLGIPAQGLPVHMRTAEMCGLMRQLYEVAGAIRTKVQSPSESPTRKAHGVADVVYIEDDDEDDDMGDGEDDGAAGGADDILLPPTVADDGTAGDGVELVEGTGLTQLLPEGCYPTQQYKDLEASVAKGQAEQMRNLLAARDGPAHQATGITGPGTRCDAAVAMGLKEELPSQASAADRQPAKVKKEPAEPAEAGRRDRTPRRMRAEKEAAEAAAAAAAKQAGRPAEAPPRG